MSGVLSPPPDCGFCPRLVALRHECRAKHPDWFNAPVPSLGGDDARLLIVGLAPGLRGANRTGRPFTGDAAGGYLFAMLARFGLAGGACHEDGNDEIRLRGVRITNAVRCLPPENRPVAAEIGACRPFLAAEIAAMPHLETILTLGRIAHDATLRCLDIARRDAPFGHAACATVKAGGRPTRLVSSYHCSRYNTQTGRLTDAMFAEIFEIITGAPEASG